MTLNLLAHEVRLFIHTHREGVLVGALLAVMLVLVVLAIRKSRATTRENKKLQRELTLSTQLAEANTFGVIAVFLQGQVIDLERDPSNKPGGIVLKRVILELETLMEKLGYDQAFFDGLNQRIAEVQRIGSTLMLHPRVAALRNGSLRDMKAVLDRMQFESGERPAVKVDTKTIMASAQNNETVAPATITDDQAAPTDSSNRDIGDRGVDDVDKVFRDLFSQESYVVTEDNAEVVSSVPPSSKGDRIKPVFDEVDGHDATTTMFSLEADDAQVAAELPTLTANPKPLRGEGLYSNVDGSRFPQARDNGLAGRQNRFPATYLGNGEGRKSSVPPPVPGARPLPPLNPPPRRTREGSGSQPVVTSPTPLRAVAKRS